MVFWKHIPLSISLWDKFQGNHEALSPWVLWTADEEWVLLPNSEKVHRLIILSVPLNPKPEQIVIGKLLAIRFIQTISNFYEKNVVKALIGSI